MKSRYIKRFVKKVLFFIAIIVILSVITIQVVEKRLSQDYKEPERMARRARPPNTTPVVRGDLDVTKFYDIKVPFRLPEIKGLKRDWNDWDFINAEQKRTGLGERGMPAYITDETQKKLEHEMSMNNGFNALLSDFISVNRSVPDVRREG